MPSRRASKGIRRLDLEAHSEQAFYQRAVRVHDALITTFGYTVAVIMAFGAFFAALNTHVHRRLHPHRGDRHPAGTRLGGVAVMVSVMIEALGLALLGGVLGGAIAYLGFNGFTVGHPQPSLLFADRLRLCRDRRPAVAGLDLGAHARLRLAACSRPPARFACRSLPPCGGIALGAESLDGRHQLVLVRKLAGGLLGMQQWRHPPRRRTRRRRPRQGRTRRRTRAPIERPN